MNEVGERSPPMNLATVLGELRRIAPPGSIDASIGNLKHSPPGFLIEALVRAVREGRNGYSPPQGVPELREGTAGLYSEITGREVDPGDVLITVGASSALLALAVRESERGILVPDPGFTGYYTIFEGVGRRVIPYRLREGDFQPEPESLKEAAGMGDMIIVSSPNNPTSTELTPESVGLIRDLAEDEGLKVVLDEPYFSIYFRGNGYHSLYGSVPEAHVVSTFGKALAVTGWRVGFMISPLARELTPYHFAFVGGPPTPPQYAIAWSLPRFEEFASELRESLRRKRDLLMSLLEGFEYPVPVGSYFLFLRVGGDDVQAARELARRGLIVFPGSLFGTGGRGYIRINFSMEDEEIRRAAEILNQYGLAR